MQGATYLELQGDAAHWTTLNALHQMLQHGGRSKYAGPYTCNPDALHVCYCSYRCEASNLVAQPLGLNDSNLLTYSLVCVEIQRETVVILFYDDP